MKEKQIKRILLQLDQFAADAGISVKPLTADTLDDALKVIRERFSEQAVEQVSNAVRCPVVGANPGRFGIIAYENNCPVSFQEAILREAYFGKNKFYVNVPGCFCTSLKSSPFSTFLVARDTINTHSEAKLVFGNTACQDAINLDHAFAFDQKGPWSCEHMRFCILRFLPFVAFIFRRKILKLGMPRWKTLQLNEYSHKKLGFLFSISNTIDIRFDHFWQRYIECNRGLVLSRDVNTLRWLFADRLERREIVLLTAEKDGCLMGYAIFKPVVPNSRKWMILDVIAVDNDFHVISALLDEVKRYLRKCTNAITLELIGLNDSAQSVLRKHLPFYRKLGNNYFIYKWRDVNLGGKINHDIMNSQESWFFGPYDGDMCM